MLKKAVAKLRRRPALPPPPAAARPRSAGSMPWPGMGSPPRLSPRDWCGCLNGGSPPRQAPPANDAAALPAPSGGGSPPRLAAPPAPESPVRHAPAPATPPAWPPEAAWAVDVDADAAPPSPARPRRDVDVDGARRAAAALLRGVGGRRRAAAPGGGAEVANGLSPVPPVDGTHSPLAEGLSRRGSAVQRAAAGAPGAAEGAGRSQLGEPARSGLALPPEAALYLDNVATPGREAGQLVTLALAERFACQVRTWTGAAAPFASHDALLCGPDGGPQVNVVRDEGHYAWLDTEVVGRGPLEDDAARRVEVGSRGDCLFLALACGLNLHEFAGALALHRAGPVAAGSLRRLLAAQAPFVAERPEAAQLLAGGDAAALYRAYRDWVAHAVRAAAVAHLRDHLDRFGDALVGEAHAEAHELLDQARLGLDQSYGLEARARRRALEHAGAQLQRALPLLPPEARPEALVGLQAVAASLQQRDP